MDPDLERESHKLAQSWDKHDADMLQDYLVRGVEDPRIHFQSILTRHFLAALLFGSELDALKTHELRFAAFSNWLLSLLRRGTAADDWHAILYALERGSDNAEGIEIPAFVVRLFAALPAEAGGVTIPNYVRDRLIALRDHGKEARNAADFSLFENLWRERLKGEKKERISVCEAACGSANDYRFVDSFGLARFIDFTGVDISEKNIANARTLFPGVRFLTGNVFALELEPGSVDACYFQDLLEHLSPEGLEKAIAELCRITRRQICAGLFSMHEGPEHLIRPVEDYYCNTLSRARTEALFARHGFRARPVHIDSYIRSDLGFFSWHNTNAYTLFIDRVG